MEFRSVLSSVTFVVLCLTFQEVKSYDCVTYCNADCGQYHPRPEFSECVSAKVHCDCSSATDSSTIIGLVVAAVVVAIIICCVICCIRGGCGRNRNAGFGGAVYQPAPAYYPNAGGVYQPAVSPSYYNNAGSPYNPAYGNTYGTLNETQPNAPLQNADPGQPQKTNNLINERTEKY